MKEPYDEKLETELYEIMRELCTWFYDDGVVYLNGMYFNAERFTEMVQDVIEKRLTTAIRETKEERVHDMGFDDLVEMVRLLLNMTYPRDVFTGESGDIGPRFTAKLHEAMDIISSTTLNEKKE